MSAVVLLMCGRAEGMTVAFIFPEFFFRLRG